MGMIRILNYLIYPSISNITLGHETTSGALTWASYVLATRPDIQDKLRDEVIQSLGTVGVPTYADIENLHYMKNFLQEVTRVYSPGKDLQPSVNIFI